MPPLSLAWWYQDDDHLNNERKKPTENYSVNMNKKILTNT
jgi:hypothetical protein